MELPAIPAGDTPRRVLALAVRRQLLDPEQSFDIVDKGGIESLVMEQSSYGSTIVAELLNFRGESVVEIRKTVNFQRDPRRNEE